MPRSGQIIPMYQHPHDEVYINDNTVYTEYTADNTGIVRYLCLFPSSKGRDTLLEFNNFSKWIDEYGYPNYRINGQLPFMPYVLLSTGLTKIYSMRLTAKDATYANMIFMVGYKEEDGKLKLKFKVYSAKNLRKIDDLDAAANSMEVTTPDEEGYKWLPLMTFWALGKGVYGTDFRIRIQHDKAADKDNDYKNYDLSILSTEEGASQLEKFNVSFYVDALDPLTNITLFAEDVLNNEDANGSTKVNMRFFTDNYQKLYNTYVDIYNKGQEEVTPVYVDRLPTIEIPDPDTLYRLTANDGSYTPGMYVYDDTTGMYAASSLAIMSVDTLPAETEANPNVVYLLNVDDTARGFVAGEFVIINGTAYAPITVKEVTKLPSTTMYEEGVVYELTADDGDKLAGTQWIYDAAVGDFVEYTGPDEDEKDPLDLTIDKWDIFGYNRETGEADEHMIIDGGTESITLMTYEGHALQNGSDGSLGEEKDKATRQAALEEAFTEALNGQRDRLLLSTRRTPFEQMYDANGSINMKTQLKAFCLKRKDFALHLDTGLLQTTADIENLITSMGTLDSYLMSVDSGMMETFDPITGRDIPVSILLWMAQAYPVHVSNFGWHTPFAGERYAIISGYTSPKKIKPTYDEELDAEILEELFVRHNVNYLQCLDEKTFVRGTQITTQKKRSDLCKENNVMLTLEIKRKIERMIAKNRYNWTDPAAIKIFKEDCEQLFSTYQGERCSKLTVDVQQTEWEKQRYILHAYLVVVFRKYQERGIVEIDLNPS